MKRVNESVEGGSENLGLKKVRFSNWIDESSSVLDRSEEGEEKDLVENGGIDSAQVDKTGEPSENAVSGSFDGLKELNKWDFDINFDLIFGNGEEGEGLSFDLNVPVYRTQNGGMENGCLGYTQGPVTKENKVEIIDIVSDDSDDEVEIIGYSNGKGKQVELGNSADTLSLSLGTIRVDDVIGESSLMNNGVRRYTREEKGKAIAVDEWLSLKVNSPDGLDLQTLSDESIRIVPTENVVIGTWQPAAAAASSESDDALRRAEDSRRYRESLYRDAWREAAKRFARIEHPDDKKGNDSPSQKIPAPTSGSIGQLGNIPGPFSEALNIVRERTSRRTAQELIEWKPSVEYRDGSITSPIVPSLLDLSMKALAENAEGMVSLELVPDNLRGRLTNILCDTGKMNVHIMNLLLKGCPTELRIKNCSWLTEKQFQQTFKNCQTKDLEVLQLDLCGQCMLDFAQRDTLAKFSNKFASLAILSLRGACRLTDSGVIDLVTSAPGLRSINLGQCTLLTCDAINFIADYLGSQLRELYIDDCDKIIPMLTLPAFKKFKCLEVLAVAGIRTITDKFISEVITVCGQSIKELDLANCGELTDCSLRIIGSNCADLCSLDISNLHNLTDLGLEYLANGCKLIRKLKLCRSDFSDEAMAAFIESSGESLTELLLNNMTKIGPHTALSLAKRSRKLLSLDLSWCRRINSEALGLIVDSCASLKLLKVFGCRQITKVFLHGHSNPLVRIIGLNLSPILEHVNMLEPEGVLLRFSALPN